MSRAHTQIWAQKYYFFFNYANILTYFYTFAPEYAFFICTCPKKAVPLSPKMNTNDMKRERSTFFIVCIWLLLMMAGAAAAMLLWALLTDRTSVAALKTLQALQVLCLFIAPALLIAWLFRDRPFSWLHLDTCPSAKTFLLAALIMLILLPGINLLSYWNQQLSLPFFLHDLEEWMKQMEEQNDNLLKLFLSDQSVFGFIINLGLMALLPAVGEELAFRGVLQGLLTSKNTMNTHYSTPHTAIWITAFIFSFVHFQFYGFLPRMLMGALFGYVLFWTGSLWVTMLMHFTNNAAAIVCYFVCQRCGYATDSLDAFGSGDTLWLGLISLVLGIICIYLFRRSLTMSKASSLTSSGS